MAKTFTKTFYAKDNEDISDDINRWLDDEEIEFVSVQIIAHSFDKHSNSLSCTEALLVYKELGDES